MKKDPAWISAMYDIYGLHTCGKYCAGQCPMCHRVSCVKRFVEDMCPQCFKADIASSGVDVMSMGKEQKRREIEAAMDEEILLTRLT